MSLSLVKAKCNVYPTIAPKSPLAVTESRGGAEHRILNLESYAVGVGPVPVDMWADTRALPVAQLRR